MGGRCARTDPDQVFDHNLVEYAFADGARLFAQTRHVNKCYDVFSDFAHGTKGSAVIMENLAQFRRAILSVHRTTFDEDRLNDVVASGDVFQQVFKKVMAHRPG